MTTKAIIFKLSNVLAFINREKAYDGISQHVPHEADDVKERIEGSDLLAQFSRNKLKDAEFFLEIMNLFDPPHSMEFSEFYGIWGDVFTTNRGLLRFLPKLKQDIKLLLMADLSVIEIEQFLKDHGELLEAFGENIIYSSEVGAAAPDDQFFGGALERAGEELSFANLLYVDADKENVTAAGQLGMQTHHYVGLLEFFADIKARQLLA